MNQQIKVAIVEDNQNIRNKLTELINGAANLKLVGIYEDGLAAVKGIPQVIPDVVVMDIKLPRLNGVECVRKLKMDLPRVNFLMLTVYEDSDLLFESLKVGAGGYLLKRTSSTRLVQAIEELHAGGSPMTPHIARQVVEFVSSLSTYSKASGTNFTSLSPAQNRTLHELAQGYSYKEIADHLGITLDGVRNHIRKIYERLHVHSRMEAVNKFLKR